MGLPAEYRSRERFGVVPGLANGHGPSLSRDERDDPASGRNQKTK